MPTRNDKNREIHKSFLGSIFSECLSRKQMCWHVHRRVPQKLFHSEYSLVAVEVYSIWLMCPWEVRRFWLVQQSRTQNTAVRISKITESLCVLYYTLLWFESYVYKVYKLTLEVNAESRYYWTDADENLNFSNKFSCRLTIQFFIHVHALINNYIRQHQ